MACRLDTRPELMCVSAYRRLALDHWPPGTLVEAMLAVPDAPDLDHVYRHWLRQRPRRAVELLDEPGYRYLHDLVRADILVSVLSSGDSGVRRLALRVLPGLRRPLARAVP